MTMTALLDPHILIKPSKELYNFMPSTFTSKCNYQTITLTSEDYKQLNFLFKKYETETIFPKPLNIETSTYNHKEELLRINDLINIHERLNHENIYLHDLIKNSTIHLPKNEKRERSLELEKRCNKLKIDQENKKYKSMINNVDKDRVQHYEDSIRYQMKELNKQLVAVFQFVVSVVTGFAFGFIGIELLIGPLDVGFKLFLGIMCSIVIGLADLYFLLKQLSATE